MHYVSWCFVYAKRTLSTNCTLQRVSRARETHISKITCRLVYVRRYILEKSCVSCTPNTYFGWWTTPSRMGMDEATMANTFQKVVSRARQMHTFKKLHSPASVSSTRDTHLQNQVLSRLRETLLFVDNLLFRLRKTTTSGGKAEPSPAQPTRAEPSLPPDPAASGAHPPFPDPAASWLAPNGPWVAPGIGPKSCPTTKWTLPYINIIYIYIYTNIS
jgi:hypothetical protein